jgi:hypothetical protein
MGAYFDSPGGAKFEPSQDHEWPRHHGVPAVYVGEVGERELEEMSGGDIGAFLRERSVSGEITIDRDSTVHHFRCRVCDRDLLLWDVR